LQEKLRKGQNIAENMSIKNIIQGLPWEQSPHSAVLVKASQMDKEKVHRALNAGFNQNPWTYDKMYHEVYQIMTTIHNVPHGFLASFRDATTQQLNVLKYLYDGDCQHELEMMMYADKCSVPVLGRVWVEDKVNHSTKVCGYIMPHLTPIAPGVNIGGASIARPKFSDANKKSIILKFREKVKQLHQAGIVHGDIKPSNALLTNTGDIELCDFPESSFLPCSHPPKRSSIQYTSPQRCKNPTKPLGIFDDIYALGTSVWEIWTEKIPYEEIDDDDIEDEIANGKQPSLSLVTDSQIKKIITDCWEGKI
jgi:serine/threonine protein kinase